MVLSYVCSCELVLTAWRGKPREGQEEGQGNLITGGSKATACTGMSPEKDEITIMMATIIKKAQLAGSAVCFLKLPITYHFSYGKES